MRHIQHLLALAAAALMLASCATMLEKAAVAGDVGMAKEALQKGEKLSEQKHIPGLAAYHGHVPFLEFLLAEKADLNAIDDGDGQTSLHRAVMPPRANGVSPEDARKTYEGKIAAAEFLIKHGASVNAEDRHHVSVLLTAVAGDMIDGLRRLKDLSTKIRDYRESRMKTLSDIQELRELEATYAERKTELEKSLADVDAAGLPFENMLSVLLKAGANTKAQDDVEGNTALHYAVLRCGERSVKSLLDKGANPNAANQGGDTPLHFASRNRPTYEALVASKADIHALNRSQLTPYDMASWRIDVWAAAATGNTKAIEEYVKAGGSVNAYGLYKGAWGWTPMHVAAYEGKTESVEALLKQKADVNPLFHPRGQFKEVAFPMSMANLGFSSLAALTSGKVPISSPMTVAKKNEKTSMVSFLEGKGGLTEIPMAELEQWNARWGRQLMWGKKEKK